MCTATARLHSEVDGARTSRIGLFVVAGLLAAGLVLGAVGAAVFAAHANLDTTHNAISVNTGHYSDSIA